MSTQTNFDLVLFGATGDLAMRKLLPCLYQAHVAGLLHPEGRILGVSRSELDTEGFLAKVETSSKIHVKENFSGEAWASFVERLAYLKVDVTQPDDFAALGDLVKARKETDNVVIYLSTAPKFFAQACENLAAIGLNADNVRVVLENRWVRIWLLPNKSIPMWRVISKKGKFTASTTTLAKPAKPACAAFCQCNVRAAVEQ